MTVKMRNKRLTEFFKIRKAEALSQGETGKGVENLAENIDAAGELSKGKNPALSFKRGEEKRRLIPQLRRSLASGYRNDISTPKTEKGAQR